MPAAAASVAALTASTSWSERGRSAGRMGRGRNWKMAFGGASRATATESTAWVLKALRHSTVKARSLEVAAGLARM
eukprot:11324175-Alexandrium_andersonii.AAC.1